MPSAGDEGYEKTVICPYDRAHEIRIGKMQFHLQKCRQNFPISPLEPCPFNTLHQIPKIEMQYHMDEECTHKQNWDRYTHEVGETVCSVKDLVPVTAGELPEAEENWGDVEVQGSVLSTIQKEVENKPLLRYKQCVSKSQRKNFRKEQRQRLEDYQKTPNDSASSSLSGSAQTNEIPEHLNAQLHKLNFNNKPSNLPSHQSPHQTPFQLTDQFFPSLGSKGSSADAEEFPSVGSSFPTVKMDYSNASSRPSTAMSLGMSSSRPASGLSGSSSYRSNVDTNYTEDDGFCPLPVPGLGRGRKIRK